MTIAIHRPWVHWRVVLWWDLSWYWCICLVPDKGAPVKHCWVVHCSMIWINCDTICMIPISCWRPKCIICEHLWGSVCHELVCHWVLLEDQVQSCLSRVRLCRFAVVGVAHRCFHHHLLESTHRSE